MLKQLSTRNRPPRKEVVPAKPGGFGTFAGVYTPSILTILGVIMYLRFGWVVGNVGLLRVNGEVGSDESQRIYSLSVESPRPRDIPPVYDGHVIPCLSSMGVCQCRMITHFYQSQRNVIIVRDDENLGFGRRQRIDVWWGGLRGNGGLMMILAYLLQTSLAWQGAEVRIRMVVPTAAADARANLVAIIDKIRTGALPDVLVANGRTFDEILRETSRDADLVFLGMAEPGDDFVAYYPRVSPGSAGRRGRSSGQG